MVYYLHGCMWLLIGSMFTLSLAVEELVSCLHVRCSLVLGDGELRGVRAVCSRGLFDLWLVLFE